MKKYYHATDFENLIPILDEGLKVGPDGIVYLTETPEDALKFVMLRGLKSILVIEVEVEEGKVEEQFDHNYNFFKCKAYGHDGDICTGQCTNFTKYEL